MKKRTWISFSNLLISRISLCQNVTIFQRTDEERKRKEEEERRKQLEEEKRKREEQVSSRNYRNFI